MRLSEVVDLVPKQTRTRFKLMGKELGQGVEASVAQHAKKEDVVNRTMEVNDNRYLSFLRVVLEHQNNPFFPRIYHVRQYRYDNRLMLFIQMERLEPINLNASVLKQIGIDLSPEYIEKEALKSLQKQHFRSFYHDAYEKFAAERDIVYRDVHNFFDSKRSRQALKAQSENPHFHEALDLLEPFFKHFAQDLHGGNWMVRPKTGQIVVIDPFVPEHVEARAKGNR